MHYDLVFPTRLIDLQPSKEGKKGNPNRQVVMIGGNTDLESWMNLESEIDRCFVMCANGHLHMVTKKEYWS